ncbi:hypothetical protein, partial [Pseudomonas viridiflava]|uniref:hypothetical protein n=1 Tax=Pseudomonas viridiflava TaxID=33069 RepID=UPI001E3B847B
MHSSSLASIRPLPLEPPWVCLGVRKKGSREVKVPDNTALPMVGYNAMPASIAASASLTSVLI